MKIRAVC